jgi:4-hydroxy-3-polyprenylbenzoate decarboxylase
MTATDTAIRPEAHAAADDPLRIFLAELAKVGELLHVEEEVDPKYEICAFLRHIADDNGPAVIFDRIKGSKMRGLANLFGTTERIAIALGIQPKDMTRVIGERLRKRIPPVLIDRNVAPCKEVVSVGDDVDLSQLPFPLWNVGDGGTYITAGLNMGAHPVWGKNAGVYRNMFRNKNEIFAQIAPDHQQRLFYQDLGKGCPMAIVLGPDPLLYLAACSDFALGDYEMDVAGALRGAPLRVVKAEAIDLEVPADAEIVIETEYTGEMGDEGPLNEYTGYQSEARKAPIWRVKAITTRKDPIMQMAFLGKPPNETCVLFRALEDGIVLDALKGRFPIVTGITRPALLARDFWCIVQTDPKKRRPGIIRNLLLALTFMMPRQKYLVAVDDDIDIENIQEVLWAISTRVDPARDTFIVADTGTGPLDPSSREVGLTSKLFIDATRKAHFRGVVSMPPKDVLDQVRVRLDKILGARTLNK